VVLTEEFNITSNNNVKVFSFSHHPSFSSCICLNLFLLSISSSHFYKCFHACNGATAIFLVSHLKMFIRIFICNGIECSTATFAASTLKPFAWIR
jgi:hypothetical protein